MCVAESQEQPHPLPSLWRHHSEGCLHGAYYPQLVVKFAMGQSRICPSCKVGGVCVCFHVCIGVSVLSAGGV